SLHRLDGREPPPSPSNAPALRNGPAGNQPLPGLKRLRARSDLSLPPRLGGFQKKRDGAGNHRFSFSEAGPRGMARQPRRRLRIDPRLEVSAAKTRLRAIQKE